MFKLLNRNLRLLYSRFRWRIRRRSKPKVIIRRFGKSSSKPHDRAQTEPTRVSGSVASAAVHPNGHLGESTTTITSVRVATFNAALFSMAPAVPKMANFDDENGDVLKTRSLNLRTKSANDRPKSILKQSPLHPNSINITNNSSENLSKQQKFTKSKLRVSINLPDNEISLLRNRKLSFAEDESEREKEGSSSITRFLRGKAPLRSSVSFSGSIDQGGDGDDAFRSRRTVLEVLKELDADILALQDVKAEEEKAMKPLSDLASALGMSYVFAESWAPEYGNAILSKWPIKHWKVQKIFDDTDFRNVLKATIDVPQVGEINFHCTHLDHLDENWRMKQINAIIQSNNEPHILVGGLNSLEETDYSQERWSDIVKYYEELGKPTPKVEVMKYLKSKEYTDAKDYAGECESVVMIAKGQSVQGTCKYGTRVDYILGSPNSCYQFVPGSYSVFSSKGTSDHHIVRVDITKVDNIGQENVNRKKRHTKKKVVKITGSSQSKGIWKTHTLD
ncbi:uncharacterized protein LOC133792479 [Humulus lupulus]|uniref:uncharacterized protein LOC133792479 n=1 Tax=Humulus lupulus TaxID=3486 RepID=UPI002B40AC76|nr:uncharacterized protein LOC133792479 [Humulus lupulus]